MQTLVSDIYENFRSDEHRTLAVILLYSSPCGAWLFFLLSRIHVVYSHLNHISDRGPLLLMEATFSIFQSCVLQYGQPASTDKMLSYLVLGLLNMFGTIMVYLFGHTSQYIARF